MTLQYAVSRRSVGSHCTPGGVTPPLGTNDQGVIQPGESLIPLTPALYATHLEGISPKIRLEAASNNLNMKSFSTGFLRQLVLYDIVFKSQYLLKKANLLFCKFKFCNRHTLTFLFRSYCLSLYGCSLWRLDFPSMNLIEVASNKILRRTYLETSV